jgi:hypothetical protein
VEQFLVHLISGTLGGHVAGRMSPDFDLGPAGNTCAGLVGGSGIGLLVSLLLPAITAVTKTGDVNLAGSITHLVAAGLGGAIAVALIAAIQNRTA